MRQSATINATFPLKGLVESTAKHAQPPGTSIDMRNMFPWDVGGRNRGGQRPALEKYCSSQISGTNRIQDINHVTNVQTAAAAQGQMQIRDIIACSVSDGDVAKFTGSTVTAATSGTNALSATVPFLFSIEYQGVLYFSDGVNTKKWTASTNTVSSWTASAGSFPVNGSDYPRLIEFWNGRIVMSGIKSDPHNWFMTAVGTTDDFEYAPTPEVETQAVSGNQGPIGKIGDVVMSMLPYTNDMLLVFCDHHIYFMSGDPAAGGRLDLITDKVGSAFGRPHCMNNRGTVYFVGSRGGLYRMTPGESLDRISQSRIEQRFAALDMNKYVVRMAWDDERVGAWLMLTNLDGVATDHYFYDERNDALLPVRFDNKSHNPVAVHVYDGDAPEDRVVLFGSEDGYIRTPSDTAKSDDGTAVEQSVTLGPFMAEQTEKPLILLEMQVLVSLDSDTVSYEVHAAKSAEAALKTIGSYLLLEDGASRLMLEDGSGFLLLEGGAAAAHKSGTFTLDCGRSSAVYPRSRGQAIYVVLKNSTVDESFSLERLRMKVATVTSGKGRRA